MLSKLFVSRGERELNLVLTTRYGTGRIYSKVRMLDALPQSRPWLPPEEFKYATRAHFDFVVTDEAGYILGAYEYDGSYHHTSVAQQNRDALKDAICQRCGFPLYRISEVTPDSVPWLGTPTVHIKAEPTQYISQQPAISAVARPTTGIAQPDKTPIRIGARWIAGTLSVSLGNLLGFVLWWRSNEWWYNQGLTSKSQFQVFCLLPFITAAIGPLLTYTVVLTLLFKGRTAAQDKFTGLFIKAYILNGLLLLIMAVPLAIYYEVSSVKEIAVTANTWLLLLATYLLVPSLIVGIYMTRRFKKAILFAIGSR